MVHRLDDAVVSLDIASYSSRPCPPWLRTVPYLRLYEKEITSRVLVERFKEECDEMVEVARTSYTSSAEHFGVGDDMPYTRVGTKLGHDTVLRRAEADFGHLLATASTLEDMVCNAAIDYSRRGLAWQGCQLDTSGNEVSNTIKERGLVRTYLRKAYTDAGHDTKAHEWVSRLRNKSTHEHYFFASVIQAAGEVVFTEDGTDYGKMDLRKDDTLTATRLIEAVEQLNRYSDWFIYQTVDRVNEARAFEIEQSGNRGVDGKR